MCKMHAKSSRLKGELLPKSVDHKDRDGLNTMDNLRAANCLTAERAIRVGELTILRFSPA